MNTIPWFERNLKFGYPIEMLPYFLERLDGTFVRLETKVKGVSNGILSHDDHHMVTINTILKSLTS